MRILSLFSLFFSFISLNLDSKRLFHCHEIKKLRVDKFHQLCLIYCSSFSMRSSTDIPARWIKSQWDAKNQLTENTFSSIKRSGTSAESNYSASFSIRLKFPWSRAKVKTVCALWLWPFTSIVSAKLYGGLNPKWMFCLLNFSALFISLIIKAE